MAQRYPWIDLDRAGIYGHSIRISICCCCPTAIAPPRTPHDSWWYTVGTIAQKMVRVAIRGDRYRWGKAA